jgi:hypothetical protein
MQMAPRIHDQLFEITNGQLPKPLTTFFTTGGHHRSPATTETSVTFALRCSLADLNLR